MKKEIIFNEEARLKLKKGIDVLANAVKVTLGPAGRNVIIQKYGSPHITKDGVSVASEIELEDVIENIGAQIVYQVANKTALSAGDGTTTATVLAQAILTEGLKYIQNGSNAIDIKRGMDKAVKSVTNFIKLMASYHFNLSEVATISANSDSVIGNMIAKAFEDVGVNGTITIDNSKTEETYLEVIKGLTFENGYLTPVFITNSTKNTTEFNNPVILIINGAISNIKDLLNILEIVMKAKRNLLIITNDIEETALHALATNKMNGTINLCIVESPSLGDNRDNILEDIAILTNGKVVFNLEDIDETYLGECKSIIVDKEKTMILGGLGDVSRRISLIKEQIKHTDDKKTLQDRLAKLDGGVGVIYVGAKSHLEMNENKDRIDDALQATRAALEEGILPGGGVTYIRAINHLNSLKMTNKDEKIGLDIIKNILESPLRQMLINAGLEPSVIVNKIKRGKEDYGFNIRTEKYEYLIKSGIIDPAKVARVAIENAVSIAGMLLTTECVVVDCANKK